MPKTCEQAAEVKLPSGRPVIGPYLGRILGSLYGCVVPDGGELPVPVSETNSVAFLAKYLRDQDPIARLGLKLLFVAFDLAPLVFIGRFSRFVNLSAQEKELYLWEWYASRIYYRRMIVVLDFIGFKLPCKGGKDK